MIIKIKGHYAFFPELCELWAHVGPNHPILHPCIIPEPLIINWPKFNIQNCCHKSTNITLPNFFHSFNPSHSQDIVKEKDEKYCLNNTWVIKPVTTTIIEENLRMTNRWKCSSPKITEGRGFESYLGLGFFWVSSGFYPNTISCNVYQQQRLQY